jgi:hypothetical protein
MLRLVLLKVLVLGTIFGRMPVTPGKIKHYGFEFGWDPTSSKEFFSVIPCSVP